jgi:hypothetical protein
MQGAWSALGSATRQDRLCSGAAVASGALVCADLSEALATDEQRVPADTRLACALAWREQPARCPALTSRPTASFAGRRPSSDTASRLAALGPDGLHLTATDALRSRAGVSPGWARSEARQTPLGRLADQTVDRPAVAPLRSHVVHGLVVQRLAAGDDAIRDELGNGANRDRGDVRPADRLVLEREAPQRLEDDRPLVGGQPHTDPLGCWGHEPSRQQCSDLLLERRPRVGGGLSNAHDRPRRAASRRDRGRARPHRDAW